MQTVTYSSDYKVGTEQVRLKVTIGEGQLGFVLIVLDGKIFKGENGFEGDLGLGSNLIGKHLRVTTIVTDENIQTDKTSVTYRLTGGPRPLNHTDACEVETNASADYEARISLVS